MHYVAEIGFSVLVLTKNEEQDLPSCLHSVACSDDVVVYDSFSMIGLLPLLVLPVPG